MVLIFGAAAAASGLARAEGEALATVPAGYITSSLPATQVARPVTTYFSTPLLRMPVYSGSVLSVTAGTLTLSGGEPVFAASAPLFVKISTGAQAGRILRLLGRDGRTLTLDTSDRSDGNVALDGNGFAVATNDRVEVRPAYTLAALFGDGGGENPLRIEGGRNIFTADAVGIYDPLGKRWENYYFNTLRNQWEKSGSFQNYGDVVLYPEAGFAVTRRGGRAAFSLLSTGHVPEIPPLTKTAGGANATRYAGQRYPLDLRLSQIAYSSWERGNTPGGADTIEIWNDELKRWDSYFQRTDLEWRKAGGAPTSQNDVVIPAGAAIGVTRTSAASGPGSLLSIPMPYTLAGGAEP